MNIQLITDGIGNAVKSKGVRFAMKLGNQFDDRLSDGNAEDDRLL